MEGLARLEYRGYDSAGVAMVAEDQVVSSKRAGKLANLVDALGAGIVSGRLAPCQVLNFDGVTPDHWVSRSDAPLSTDDPLARSTIVAAESRFAASSKLDSVGVDDL